MDNQRILPLFGINLATMTVGSSMGTLIPVYATRLGANAEQAGFLMSSIFIGMVCGGLVAGRVADRRKYRKPLLVTAGLLLVILFLAGTRIQALWQLALFSVALTFLDGMQIAMVGTLAGLYAGKGSRGHTFGILGSAGALGGLASGLSGSVVLQWGFPGLFAVAAVITLIKPLLALLVDDHLDEQALPPAAQPAGNRPPARAIFSRAFLLLFLASITAYLTAGIFSLSRSLGMIRAGFDTAAISSTVAVGALISLPFPLLMGWFSDRIGRRALLGLCYAAGAASLLLLAVSTQLWHIWAASALHAILNASLGIGSALVTDLTPRETLGSALSTFNTTNWIGMIAGHSLTGAAIHNLGLLPVLIAGAVLALAAVILVAPRRQAASPALPATASSDRYA